MWERSLGNVPSADVAVTDTGVVGGAGSGQVPRWAFAQDGMPLAQDDLTVGEGPQGGAEPRTHPRTIGIPCVQREERPTWTPTPN